MGTLKLLSGQSRTMRSDYVENGIATGIWIALFTVPVLLVGILTRTGGRDQVHLHMPHYGK